MQVTTIEDLPRESIEYICSYLTPTDFVSFCSTNSYYHASIQDDALWRLFFDRTFSQQVRDSDSELRQKVGSFALYKWCCEVVSSEADKGVECEYLFENGYFPVVVKILTECAQTNPNRVHLNILVDVSVRGLINDKKYDEVEAYSKISSRACEMACYYLNRCVPPEAHPSDFKERMNGYMSAHGLRQ